MKGAHDRLAQATYDLWQLDKRSEVIPTGPEAVRAFIQAHPDEARSLLTETEQKVKAFGDALESWQRAAQR